MKTHTFERSSEIAAPAIELRNWHFAEGAFAQLTPPWEKATVIQSPGELTDGCRAIIEIRIGPLKQKWVAEHQITEQGFVDRQVTGPFTHWEHHHRFLPLTDTSSRLVDSIHYRLPMGSLGNLFGNPFVRAKLKRMFDYRHQVTRKALER